MDPFTIQELEQATKVVYSLMLPTPAYAWPLLASRVGLEVVVKHENHTPTGSFKARGGLVYIDALKWNKRLPKGLVTATRGNHGQSIAIGAARAGIPSLIVVPEGNSPEKNAAMQAFGGEVIISGKDFDDSRAIANKLQRDRGYHFIPSFHRDLVLGVATYAYELFQNHLDLDAVYVPIGMGSGIAALIGVRDLLGLPTEIIGVVAEEAPSFALSFEAGHIVPTPTARTFADGMACRDPQEEPFSVVRKGASRIVTVSEDEIAEAIRIYFTDTHNVAEGAGAAALAALIKDGAKNRKRVAVILCGGNIDLSVIREVLGGKTPIVG